MTDVNEIAKDIVIFGAAGDLSRRKLLPALYQLDAAGLLVDKCRIIGVARQDFTESEFVELVKENIETFVKKAELDANQLAKFLLRIKYQKLDITDSSSYQGLALSLIHI